MVGCYSNRFRSDQIDIGYYYKRLVVRLPGKTYSDYLVVVRALETILDSNKVVVGGIVAIAAELASSSGLEKAVLDCKIAGLSSDECKAQLSNYRAEVCNFLVVVRRGLEPFATVSVLGNVAGIVVSS